MQKTNRVESETDRQADTQTKCTEAHTHSLVDEENIDGYFVTAFEK